MKAAEINQNQNKTRRKKKTQPDPNTVRYWSEFFCCANRLCYLKILIPLLVDSGKLLATQIKTSLREPTKANA